MNELYAVGKEVFRSDTADSSAVRYDIQVSVFAPVDVHDIVIAQTRRLVLSTSVEMKYNIFGRSEIVVEREQPSGSCGQYHAVDSSAYISYLECFLRK